MSSKFVHLADNTASRWAHVHDLFELEKRLPSTFSGNSDREDAEVFRDLHKIAHKNPGSQFWENMANKEAHAKGKRSRILSLVLPDGFENMLQEDQDPGAGDSSIRDSGRC